jgi:hypothetical protein
MALDIHDVIDRTRIWTAIKSSRNVLDLFDGDRSTMLRDYAGPLYSPYDRLKTARYVNKLNSTARIYQMALAFNNPQCKITSWDQKLWPFARKYEVNVNKVAANINLNVTMQECVLDAFFLLGTLKVRMASAGVREVEPNVWLDPGKPWVDRVSISDLILDMPAKSLRNMRFYGDRYRASFDAVRHRDDFDSKVTRKMSPSSKLNQNASSERGDAIAFGNAVDDDELEPMCWLMDLYLPRERQFATLCADQDGLAPLKVEDWDGSDQGPYKFMAFGYMPDNVMPTTPAQQLVLLDRLMNRLYGKLASQAKRQKNTVAFAAGKDDVAQRGKEAEDGEFWNGGLDPKNSLVPVNFPGIDGNTHAFFMAAQEVYNTQAGNERALGGLGEEAGTLGQEQMIGQKAAGLIGYLKGQVNNCAADVMREIGALMWDDNVLTVDSSVEAGTTGYRVDASWKPGDRQGLKDHYDFAVEPNSMAFRPPEAKLNTLTQFVGTFVQAQPAIQAGLIDGQEFARIFAEYTNTPEIMRIVKQMQMGNNPADPHQATKAPNTSREVVRRSAPGGPRGQGTAAVLSQMMQGRGAPQGAMVGGGR